ncbi:MAG: hypothetical protein LQ350_003623 [Teloschistes chrysophthalmus]|nr:MAG: hypothetical protein LQ350_003623 [Niorma chrysophthalma]
MAGIIAVYSLVIAVLIAGAMDPSKKYSLFKYVPTSWLRRTNLMESISGFLHLAAGLSVGLTGLAAGYAIGIVGDASYRRAHTEYEHKRSVTADFVQENMAGPTAAHMAARPDRPAKPARHGSYLSQRGWFPKRRNALIELDQAPVVPSPTTIDCKTASVPDASAFASSQWSQIPTPLNRWASMATASLKHGAHKLLGHNKPAASDSSPFDSAKCQQEKQNISDHCENAKPLPPDQIATSPRNKVLATSSKNLRIQDFELIKTLGTGERIPNDDTREDTMGILTYLDYCPGGEVFTYLRRAKKFDIEIARFYAAEIVLILEFLHTVQGIAYRDMKPENILIDAEGHLKLVDFGFAKKIETRETYTLCGTPEYLAPEVIRNSVFNGKKSGHGTAVDWWAFGILVYEFLVGQPPFWNSNPMKIYEMICEGKLKFPKEFDPDARDLISGLCVVNPTHRLGNLTGGVDRVKSHPFFASMDWEALYYRRLKGPIIPTLRHAADASNFDDYGAAPEHKSVYTKEMASKYDTEFKDF